MTLVRNTDTKLIVSCIPGIVEIYLVQESSNINSYLENGFCDPTAKEMKSIVDSGIKLPTQHTFVGRTRDDRGHCHLKPVRGVLKHTKRKKLETGAITILVKRKP